MCPCCNSLKALLEKILEELYVVKNNALTTTTTKFVMEYKLIPALPMTSIDQFDEFCVDLGTNVEKEKELVST